MEEIINKVAASGLVTIDLEETYPSGERVELDIAPVLWQGLALREKEYRDWIAQQDWKSYSGKHVAFFCSADAIIQPWAFMLLASRYEIGIGRGRNRLVAAAFDHTALITIKLNVHCVNRAVLWRSV